MFCSTNAEREKEVKKMIRKKFRDLGPMSFHEGAVLLLFIICVMLWFFRDPGFVPGWAHFIEDAHVDDATAVMIIVLFLFSIPAKPAFWCLRAKGGVYFGLGHALFSTHHLKVSFNLLTLI